MKSNKYRMAVVIVPGFSLPNKDWAYSVKDKLGGKASVHEWKHWQTGNNADFSLSLEAEKIASNIQEKADVIAKSIGTLVAMLIIEKINKLILCGLPLNDIDENDKEKYKALSNFDPKKAVCFQNEDDPHGSYKDVKEFLKNTNPKVEVIKMPGDTHDYPYFEDFQKFLLT